MGGSPPWAPHAAGSGPAAALCLSSQTSRRGSTPSGAREKPREATHKKKLQDGSFPHLGCGDVKEDKARRTSSRAPDRRQQDGIRAPTRVQSFKNLDKRMPRQQVYVLMKSFCVSEAPHK